jgi:hypothetical protein
MGLTEALVQKPLGPSAGKVTKTTGIVTTGVHLKWRMSSQTFEKFEMVLL